GALRGALRDQFPDRSRDGGARRREHRRPHALRHAEGGRSLVGVLEPPAQQERWKVGFMAAFLIHIELDDLDELMEADARYAGATGQELVVSRSSVQFHHRTAHSVVARDGTDVRGFVLAHASWSGGRPVVRVERLAGAAPSVGPLLEAVLKSAYDARVYDIV